jgi:biotin transport system substrate-specific component
MMQQTALAQDRSSLASGSRRFAVVIGATAFVALCAHISIPLGFTPVPITLQPFAVLLLGLLMTPRDSFSALAVYLMAGATGMPVFSPHGLGGIAQLFGPTGGYLLAAPFAAAIAGLLYRSCKQRAWAAFAGAAIGDLILLATGALWLEVLTHTSLSALLSVSVAPFLASDAAKVIAAAACALIFRSFATRTSSPAQQR